MRELEQDRPAPAANDDHLPIDLPGGAPRPGPNVLRAGEPVRHRGAVSLVGVGLRGTVHVDYFALQRPTAPGHRSLGSQGCLSYTLMELTFFPLASISVLLTVRLIPSAESLMVPVMVTLSSFFAVNLKVRASTLA